MNPTVRQFLDVGADRLSLRFVGDEGDTHRPVREPSINRPGLALTGFFRYFAHRRIQVFGLAEMTYLKSLKGEDRRARLHTFFAQRVPCVIISRNLRPLPTMVKEARQTRTPLLRTSLVTNEFLQRGAVLMADLIAPTLHVQGTMVDLMGVGVLIDGSPGIGKSETALSLVARGFSLVSDDVTELRRLPSGFLLASAPKSTRYHMDIRGLGIVHVPSLYGVASIRLNKRLDLIIQLKAAGPGPLTESPSQKSARKILGVSVPCFTVPTTPGRDAAQLVVTAALNYRLSDLGHDAAKDLDQHLMLLLAKDRGETGD